MWRVDGWFRIGSLVTAVFTADLIVRRVDAAAAALRGVVPGLGVGLAVHHSVATLALAGVVHGRSAAVRVPAEDAIAQLSVTADLGGLSIVGRHAAAGVVPTVDDFVAATL